MGANITLMSPAGRNYTFGPLNQGGFQTFMLSPPLGTPVYPNAVDAFQVDETNRRTKIRFITITAAPYQCLHLR